MSTLTPEEIEVARTNERLATVTAQPSYIFHDDWSDDVTVVTDDSYFDDVIY